MPVRRGCVHGRHLRRVHEHDVGRRVDAGGIGIGKREACKEEEEEGERELHWRGSVTAGGSESEGKVEMIMAAGWGALVACGKVGPFCRALERFPGAFFFFVDEHE